MNIFQDNQNYFDPYQRTCQHTQNLFEPQETIMLGNLFKNLYMSWDGFSNYCLQPENKRQKSLLEVQMYSFVAHEINLYLDMYPDNHMMTKLYNEYANKAKKATAIFEKEFGPLTVQMSSDKTPFEWVQGPWPWEYQK